MFVLVACSTRLHVEEWKLITLCMKKLYVMDIVTRLWARQLPVWRPNIPNPDESFRYLDASPTVLHVVICARHWKSLNFSPRLPNVHCRFLFILLRPPSRSHPATMCVNSTTKSGSSSATSRRDRPPPSSLHLPVLLPPFQSEPLVRHVVRPFLLHTLQPYKPLCGPLGPTLVHQAIPPTLPQSRYRMVFQVDSIFS